MNMTRPAEKGNSTAIILAVIAVIAVGGLAYFAYNMKNTEKPAAETAAAETDQNNPVVAKVADENIYRADVVNYINALPLQARQLPLNQLYPAALDQLIADKLVRTAAKQTNLATDKDVLKAAEEAKQDIIATKYLQDQVNAKVTEDDVKKAYASYVENFPAQNEALVSHILVEDEKKADELYKKLKAGESFIELAQQNSLDKVSLQNGGKVGYFLQQEVAPEFGEVSFSLPVGEISPPVKTQFGWHIIKVEDRRLREPAAYDVAKPILEAQLRQQALQATLLDLRQNTDLEVFDINGNPIEPAAGNRPVVPAAPEANADGAPQPAKE